jgi:hypothetical protein
VANLQLLGQICWKIAKNSQKFSMNREYCVILAKYFKTWKIFVFENGSKCGFVQEISIVTWFFSSDFKFFSSISLSFQDGKSLKKCIKNALILVMSKSLNYLFHAILEKFCFFREDSFKFWEENLAFCAFSKHFLKV